VTQIDNSQDILPAIGYLRFRRNISVTRRREAFEKCLGHEVTMV
jgi:hypothetical protein